MQDHSSSPHNQKQTPPHNQFKNNMIITLFSSLIILLICLVGVEIFKNNRSPQKYAEAKASIKKPLRIASSKQRKTSFSDGIGAKGSQHIALETTPTKSFESLRFSQLEKSLAEKEALHLQSNETIHSLNHEIDIAQKKIKLMDLTLDTLANRLEMQRAEKEKMELNYREQMFKLGDEAQAKTEQLGHEMQESLTRQQELETNLQAKIAKINKLTAAWKKQEKTLLNQAEEILKLNAHIEDNLSQEIVSLKSSVQFEKSQNKKLLQIKQSLNSELADTREALYFALSDLEENNARMDEAFIGEAGLMKLVSDRDASLAMKALEFDTLFDNYAKLEKDMSQELQNLAFFIDLEKSSSKQLHQQLAQALNKCEVERHRAQELEAKLQMVIQQTKESEENSMAQNALSVSKQNELQMIVDTLSAAQADSKEQFELLTLLSEVEQLKSHQSLKQLYDEQMRSHELYQALRDSQEQNQKLTEQLTEQYALYGQVETEMMHSVNSLKSNLKLEKSRVQDLTHDLKNTVAQYQEERERAYELEEVLIMSIERAQILEENLDQHRSLLASKENEIKLNSQEYTSLVSLEAQRKDEALSNMVLEQARVEILETELAQEKGKVQQLQSELEMQRTLLTEKQKESSETTRELTNALDNQKTRADELSYSLESLDHAKQKYEEEIAELRISLSAEEARSEEIANALKDAFTEHYTQQQQTQDLEEKLSLAIKKAELLEKEFELQLTNLNQKELAFSQSFEKEQEQARDLKNALNLKASFEAELSERTQELIECRENIARSMELQQELQQQLTEQQDKVTLLENERAQRPINEIQDTIAVLTTELMEKEQKASELENKLHAANAKVTSLESEMNEQLERFANKEKELHSAAENEQNIEALNEELSSLRDQAHHLEALLKDQKSLTLQKEQQQEAMTEELSSNKSRVWELEQQLIDVFNQAERIDQDAQAANQLKLNSLEEELKATADRTLELEGEIASQRAHVMEKESELSIIRGNFTAAQAEVNSSQEVYHMMQETLAQYNEECQRVETLNAQLAAAEQKIQLTENELNQKQQHIVSQDNALEEQTQHLANALNEQKNQTDQALQSLQEALTNFDREQNYVKSLELQLQEAEQAQSRLADKNSMLDVKEEELQSIMESYSSLNNELAQEIKQLKNSLHFEQREREVLSKELQEIMANYTAEQQYSHELEQQLSDFDSAENSITASN